jgi:hypothetical protein
MTLVVTDPTPSSSVRVRHPPLWRCYYDPTCQRNAHSSPAETSDYTSNDVSWNAELHAPSRGPAPLRPSRDMTAMAYSLSGLFDGIVNCGGAFGGVPTPQAGLREMCRYVLLLYHFQTTASSVVSSDGAASVVNSSREEDTHVRRRLLDLDNISSTVMSLVSPTVLSALIPTLKGHRRIMSRANQIYARLSEDVSSRGTAVDDPSAPRTAVPLSMFKAFLAEVLTVTMSASLSASPPSHSSAEASQDVVRIVIPTSTGETSMDCVVPVAADVIRSVVAGECRSLRVPKHKLVLHQEFIAWLLHTAPLLCTIPGGYRERSVVSDVELLLTDVMLPAARRVGHLPSSTLVDADPDELLDAAGSAQHRRPSPRTTRKAAAVDGSDSRAWIASRVPAMLSRPKPQQELHGTCKGLNDEESIEGLQRVLRPPKGSSGTDQTLEAKLMQQGALRLVDAYPMKLKQQPLVVQPPPPAPLHRRR